MSYIKQAIAGGAIPTMGNIESEYIDGYTAAKFGGVIGGGSAAFNRGVAAAILEMLDDGEELVIGITIAKRDAVEVEPDFEVM